MAWVQLEPGASRDRRRASRTFCRGPHRRLQDAALLEVRRRVPDDGHRQGAEVPHARDRRSPSWACRRPRASPPPERRCPVFSPPGGASSTSGTDPVPRRRRPSCSSTKASAPSRCGGTSPRGWPRPPAAAPSSTAAPATARSDPVPLPRPLRFMHDEALVVLPEVLDAAGVRDAVLVGHSDGGSIALIHAGSPREAASAPSSSRPPTSSARTSASGASPPPRRGIGRATCAAPWSAITAPTSTWPSGAGTAPGSIPASGTGTSRSTSPA